MPSRIAFVDHVADERELVVTEQDAHSCRLESPRSADLVWYCDLDDGTPTDTERDPASYVRWVCPQLEAGVSTLEVSRPGPHSDLGKLWRSLGRLAGPQSTNDEQRFAYTDPHGVLDAALRHRIEHWPTAMHGDGEVRPAELWSIKVTDEGLVVESVSWWDSAPALDHQIGLACDLARRLSATG